MRILAWMLSSAMFVGFVGIIFVMLVIRHYSADLPEITQLQNYNPPVVSRVHAGDGRLMAEFASERRVFVPIARIPQRVIDAFLSAEDKNFYTHPGVDFMGLSRAVLTNVENMGQGRRPVGASTITQQVAKNFLVGNEVSVVRKIREAILAFRIERAYTKDEILELYMNEIFLGQRAYGVGSAALAYFNKTLDELTIGEAAYLAGLPKAPNNYHPVRNREEAIDRRKYVLDRLLADARITKPEYDVALAEPLEIQPRSESEFYRGGDYFSEEIRRDLVARYGEKAVLEGGLLVRATVDPRLQDVATKVLRNGLMAYDRARGWRGPVDKVPAGGVLADVLKTTVLPPGAEGWSLAAVTDLSAEAAEVLLPDGTRGTIPLSELKWAKGNVAKPSDVLRVRDIVLVEKLEEGNKAYALRQIPAVQGGLVAMDANTGRVLAMVGGFSPRMSAFNRATQAWRQPGSSFKPYVYMAALDNGFTPSSLVLDAPISLSQGPGLPMWTPGNYTDDYLGPTTLRVGMEKSRNVMTVRLAAQIGIDKIAGLVERLGVVDHLKRNLSMSLGAGETTVLRQVAGYAQIVNGGRKILPTFIDSIQDKEGHIVYRHDARACQGCMNVAWLPDLAVPSVPDERAEVLDPRTAYQMVHILEGVIERGTGTRIKGLPWPLAGKTGTSNDEKDAWFVGFSADMAVGLYIGFDQPRHLGDHQTGGVLAAPVFRAFMEEAMKDTPPVPFRVPPGLRLVRVNAATGRLADGGEANAIWEAFRPGTEPRPGSYESAIDPAIAWDGASSQPETDGPTEIIRMPSAGDTGGDAATSAPTPSYLPPPDAQQDDSGLGGIY